MKNDCESVDFLLQRTSVSKLEILDQNEWDPLRSVQRKKLPLPLEPWRPCRMTYAATVHCESVVANTIET